jgi:hypothetical protein
MASNAAFNNMLGGFYDDLLAVFPDNKVIQEASKKPRTRLTMDRFMKYTGSRSHLLSSRDPSFFSEKNKFMKEIGVCDVWNELSDKNKEAVWGHIQNMYMLGTSISMLPPQMLAMVEGTAEKFAKEVTEGGEFDEAKLMSSMQKMMAQMMTTMGSPGPSQPRISK